MDSSSIRPFKTIAIPSFNQGRFHDEALSSIIQQQVSVEVVVIDDGLTDNSAEITNILAPQLAGCSIEEVVGVHQRNRCWCFSGVRLKQRLNRFLWPVMTTSEFLPPLYAS